MIGPKGLFVGALAVSAALAMSAPVARAADDVRSQIVEACLTQAAIPNEVCDCMADRAMSDEFNDQQREWLVKAITDPEEGAQIAQNLPQADAVEIGMFLATAPGQCAAKG